MCSFTVIPDAQNLIVRRGNNVGILSIPLDLRSTCKPVAKGKSRLSSMPKVPAMHKTINGAGGKDVRMMSRKVDICNGSTMGM